MPNGVIIADVMGLGKTPQEIAICELVAKADSKSKFLFVVPATLKINTIRQIRKFTGKQPHVFFNAKPSEQDMEDILFGKEQYYIINYELLGRETEIKHKESKVIDGVFTDKESRYFWAELISMANFTIIGYDEAHKLKNVDSNRSKASRKIKHNKVIFLTGTPVINRPGELWPMLNIIDPQTFPSHDRFMRQYTYDGKTARNTEELRELLKPIMIRRTKEDIYGEDLPLKRRIYEYSQLSEKAQYLYNKILAGIYIDMSGVHVSVTDILAQIIRLKQVCAIDTLDQIAEKAIELYDSVRDDNTKKHKKIILFTQFISTAKSLQKKLGGEAHLIMGMPNMSLEKRMEVVDQFQKDDTPFLVATTLAASEGLDITAAGTVMFADLLWTPAGHEQAEDRAYMRNNDPHGIDAYYFIKENTIMEWIKELLDLKEEVIGEIVEGVQASRDTSVANELIKRMREEMFKVRTIT
jgi:SNF2 family DNA or RNA helicase